MKKFVSLALALVLCAGALPPPAHAASDEAVSAAEALYEEGLFFGTGTDSSGNPIFELDRTPTRHEAVTMLVRILGAQSEALSETWDTPFTDVANWAKPYVGYAYANGLTHGTSATTYGGEEPINATQYLSFVLCALGFENGKDFLWNQAWVLSDAIGLTNGEYHANTASFSRGDVALISYQALTMAQEDDEDFTTPEETEPDTPVQTLIPVITDTASHAESCSHHYNSLGICDTCGAMYPYEVTESSAEIMIARDAFVQSKPYGDSQYYQYTLSAGNRLTISGITVNHYGNTWYRIGRTSWVCSDRCEMASPKPVITISSEVSPSGSLKQGSNFGIRGIVKTDAGKITKVYGAIVNSSGVTVQDSTYYPNAAEHNLRYSINNDLIFNRLTAGSYQYIVQVWADNNGTETFAQVVSSNFEVTGNTPAAVNPSGNTYVYRGTTFQVVPNLKSEYCFNQNDYSRFENSAGRNRGCTATAMCIAYSIYHDTILSPNSVRWSSGGTSWEYCKRYAKVSLPEDALKAAYDCVLNNRMPVIVGVKGPTTSSHVVTVVGVNQNAARSSLTLSDFLIVDPYGGAIRTLSYYNSLDCEWALRIPI